MAMQFPRTTRRPRPTPTAAVDAVPLQQLPHQPLLRAQHAQRLLAQLAWRGAGVHAAAAATLPWAATDLGTWHELWALQAAVAERLLQQQRDWAEGCLALLQDYAQLGRANTVAKVMDQEFDIAARFGALAKDQAAELVELLENAQVNWGWWIARRQARAGDGA